MRFRDNGSGSELETRVLGAEVRIHARSEREDGLVVVHVGVVGACVAVGFWRAGRLALDSVMAGWW